ncbi:MAG: hypothetical protein RIC19_05880 [Phaeodactylibacter sp.]|uniref:photoactive yellow protein n=1 Tax=Phaeodactylibacter sp. TaxID=1940289 RepID=UPI0032EB5947
MHNFESKDLHLWLDQQSDEHLDQLPYGLIKMNYEGIIQAYNVRESSYTGVQPAQAIGKHFFTEIAPCTNNFMVAGKFNSPEVDETVDYIFTYVMKPTPVRLRLLRSDSPFMYLLVEKR